MSLGPAHRDHRAFSKVATTAVAIIIVGAVAAGAYIGVATHSGARSHGALSPSPTQATTVASVAPPAPLPTIVFGASVQPDNSSLEVIPANTFEWTSWTINATTQVNADQTSVIVSSQYVGSSITIAIYVGPYLAGNETYQVYPAILPIGPDAGTEAPNATITIVAPMITDRIVSSGTTVSLAIFSPTPMTAYFTNSIGVETNEASIDAGAGPPGTLPSPESTTAGTVELFAWYE